MPFRRRAFSRRSMRPVINSLKRSSIQVDTVGTTLQNTIIAKAVDTPVTSVNNDVKNGCIIKAIWLSIDFCGLAASGVQQSTGLYMFKNPGANLTTPGAFNTGTSNEKKYIIKEWSQMTMRNQDGNPPYHWEGWIKIPKRYHRMGTDDLWQLVYQCDSAAGHIKIQFIYKYYF